MALLLICRFINASIRICFSCIDRHIILGSPGNMLSKEREYIVKKLDVCVFAQLVLFINFHLSIAEGVEKEGHVYEEFRYMDLEDGTNGVKRSVSDN